MKRQTRFVALSLLLVLCCAGVSNAAIMGIPGCEGVPIPGTIDLNDLTQTNRLFRDGVPDTCAAPGTCGAPIAGTYHYDLYTFRNYDAITQCVTVSVDTTCSGTNFIYAGSYIGGFNPASICTNNIASIGSSPDGTAPQIMSFDVPAATNVDIVVAEVTASAGCPAYTLTVTGCSLPVELMRFTIE